MGKQGHETDKDGGENGLMAVVKTRQQTGLSIERKDKYYTLTWKIGDKNYYDGQICMVRCNHDKFRAIDIGKTSTSKTHAVDYLKYYPNTKTKLTQIQFALRGNREAYTESGRTIDPVVSDWVYKDWQFWTSSAPKLSVARSDQVSTECTFSWSVNASDTAHVVFQDCEWQSVLLKDSTITSGSKVPWSKHRTGWQTGTGGATGSKVIREETELLAGASYTRWFRVRARDAAGPSDWRYVKHVYARPYRANISNVKVKGNGADGYSCTVTWAVGAPASHPIDTVTVQYAFGVPDPGMTCPDSVSWTDAGVIRDTGGNDALTFSVDQTVGLDQCMFVRVNTHHDTNTTYGAAKVAAVGRLADPASLSVAVNESTHKVTITCTNQSSVEDSFLQVNFVTDKHPGGFCCGIIPHGEPSVTVQCPDWSQETAYGFKVRAVVGSYTEVSRADGATAFAVTEIMRSNRWLTYGGSIPQAPSNVSLAMTDTPGTVQVTFDWAWQEADVAEISWADHADAWESTDEPNTYIINSINASRWNIAGLKTGVTWYVRVRLGIGSDDNRTFGAYSDAQSIDLSSAPVLPVLTLSDAVITAEGEVTASWVYVSTDATEQAGADLAEVVDGAYIPLATVDSAQYLTISAAEAGWNTGEAHTLAVRVFSASGRETGWSDPVSVYVAEPINCTITQTSLERRTVTVDGESITLDALTEMPLTVTVVGAGEGTTMLSIVRAETYHITRPDESDVYGFEGETVVSLAQTGESQMTIYREDLIGRLDDGAQYIIIATTQDGLGQSASAEMPFTVMWDHQAEIPNGTVTIISEHLAAKLQPVAPNGVGVGDTCDIYRLSVDRPQLVYSGATYGQTYVDPYPAVGEYGGYRFVMSTVDGDYITADNELAWVDVPCEINSNDNIIDFDGGRILLSYNPDVSNSWKKDFKETKYLGGSVQGDWNPAVSRTSSVNSVAITATDQTTIEAMRRLATHAGICHVRTRDGSSYAADVQVSESYAVSNGNKLASFSLSITRVDPEGIDGMTLAEWEALHTEG